MDAALLLGHFGDPEARPKLQEIIAQADRHPQPLVILACWYTLKVDKKDAAAAVKLAELIK